MTLFYDKCTESEVIICPQGQILNPQGIII